MSKGWLGQSAWCSHEADLYRALTLNNPPVSTRERIVFQVYAAGVVVHIQAFTYSDTDNGICSVLEVTGSIDTALEIAIATDQTKSCFRLTWPQHAAAK